jgi:hypothetical protein
MVIHAGWAWREVGIRAYTRKRGDNLEQRLVIERMDFFDILPK